jgi:hypothetical protein
MDSDIANAAELLIGELKDRPIRRLHPQNFTLACWGSVAAFCVDGEDVVQRVAGLQAKDFIGVRAGLWCWEWRQFILCESWKRQRG